MNRDAIRCAEYVLVVVPGDTGRFQSLADGLRMTGLNEHIDVDRVPLVPVQTNGDVPPRSHAGFCAAVNNSWQALAVSHNDSLPSIV